MRKVFVWAGGGSAKEENSSCFDLGRKESTKSESEASCICYLLFFFSFLLFFFSYLRFLNSDRIMDLLFSNRSFRLKMYAVD